MSNKMVCQTNTTFRSLHLPMSLFTISEDANHNHSSSTSSSNIYQAFESPLSLSRVFRSSKNINPLCFRGEDDDKDDQDENDRRRNSHAIVVAALNIVKETNTMTHEESREEEEQYLAACPHNSSSSSSSRWDAARTTCASQSNSSLKMPSPSISHRRTRRNSMPLRRVSLSSSRSSSGVDQPPTCPVRSRSGRTRNFEPVSPSVSRKRIRRHSIPSRSVSFSSSSRSSVVDRPPTCPIRKDSSHKT